MANVKPDCKSVDGVPDEIKEKILEFATACDDYALFHFGALDNYDEVLSEYETARYNLERTIKTYLDKNPKHKG